MHLEEAISRTHVPDSNVFGIRCNLVKLYLLLVLALKSASKFASRCKNYWFKLRDCYSLSYCIF